MSNLTSPALHDEFSRFIAQARTPRLRPLSEFVYAEAVVAKGKYRGTKFQPETQPFWDLVLRELDKERYPRCAFLRSGRAHV